MHRRLPTIAILLGAAGLLPFLVTGLGAATTGDIADEARYVAALAAYGAVILAFLGGVHWGFVLSPPSPEASARTRYRLILGVAPALLGWGALLVGLIGLLDVAVAILAAGFVAFTLAETVLWRRGFVPPGYMWLRWLLTVVVVLVLAATLLLRLTGLRLGL